VLRDYASLESHLLKAGSGYAHPNQTVLERVTLDAPAVHAMTDFKAITAVIVLSGDSMNEAHRRMIQRGVRLLLVVDQDRCVVGVITSADVLGEKPMRVVSQRAVSAGRSSSCAT